MHNIHKILFQFNLNGLLNNPELSALFSAILNDNFCTFIDTYSKVISNIISPIAEVVINKILAKNTTAEELTEEFEDIMQSYQMPQLY